VVTRSEKTSNLKGEDHLANTTKKESKKGLPDATKKDNPLSKSVNIPKKVEEKKAEVKKVEVKKPEKPVVTKPVAVVKPVVQPKPTPAKPVAKPTVKDDKKVDPKSTAKPIAKTDSTKVIESKDDGNKLKLLLKINRRFRMDKYKKMEKKIKLKKK
jgi:hypothetical protein